MIKLGIIGTGWITQQFINACIESGDYQLHSVFSRKLATAKQFAENNNGKIKIFDDLKQFLADSNLEVIYIASPNSLHFSQAMQALRAGKHVIVEKSAFSTPEEMAEIIELAEKNQLLYFEAARNLHETSFEQVKRFIEGRTIIGANFTYAKYSSKMPQYLAGEVPNIFNPKFSTGALADLGVYLLYAAIGWFGKPQSSKYFPTMISTGVDISGTGLLFYEGFNVIVNTGKNINSHLKSEIYFTDGTLELDGVNAISSAVFKDLNGLETVLPVEVKLNPMIEEASHFAEVIKNQSSNNIEKYLEWQELSRDVNQILTDMRHFAGVIFAADHQE
ncbi:MULTISPECIES: Gfo/Idh/MocA family oxidoreductase [unclassified Enterococcus]|uniref:Gfo/Idh/MocA family protein n=1 Tax=unclassified Enterococcus TaxID=2608891 RepID=UPI0015534B02|nr:MULTISPECIES: Gfo/Idh/MocA family oxidoreductase [unclassified Enterococcus]MBS7577835.1 Gfo/Idh/MocA family oxidoreductase [Enterococcus sp. MMGLQ5-2]MBS7585095.1 Gfo/Idh/MocA family oxidoreductase [Enterococcus sp. MMGLQ5-1]NPD12951.1 Gfo/Idh/MocA family oxidoreductase [Enterococcus sp. MMGLQ5-1]NPD37665.1 Gfo/Idh/MocA family oxidoreductase [Enterococcus sp. MMGLQ5-2]